MKKTFLIICMSSLFLSANAQQRSETEAKGLAQSFMQAKTHSSKSLAPVPNKKVMAKVAGKTDTATNADAPFYIFNSGENDGFVIVSGDAKMRTILGYSDKGRFNEENIPLGLQGMLKDYMSAYEYARTNDIPAYTESETTAAPVAPMITTTWGQDDPFNRLCPEFDVFDLGVFWKSSTGCIATAMAQVMNYHKYPNQGTGSYSYTSETNGYELSMDFSQTVFDWGNMLDVYDENSPEAAIEAVSQLMYACGIAVAMDYNTDGWGTSGAYNPDLAYALINNFGYNKGIGLYMRDYFSDEEWHSIIQKDLEAGLPIIYSGVDDTGGHEFILDGSDGEGYYHFNWGWNGDSNGYFSIDALSPNEDYDYTSTQSMVCHISPENLGGPQDILYTEEFYSWFSNNDLGDNTYFTFNGLNLYSPNTTTERHGTKSFSLGLYGIGVFDKDFNFLSSLYESFVMLDFGPIWSGYLSMSTKTIDVELSPEVFKNGNQYYIAPYAKNFDNDNVTRIRTLGGESDYYLATVENDEVELTLMGKIDDIPTSISNVNNATGLEVYAGDNIIVVRSNAKTSVNVYSVTGTLVDTFVIEANSERNISVPEGVYMVNGKKVLVK